MKIDIARVLTCTLFGGALLLPLVARAEPDDALTKKTNVDATPSETETDPDKVIRLEEFKVSTTVETYTETSTSAATKVPMDMKDVAGTLQVLNASFIADKRAGSLEDLYPYIVGMTRESPAASGFTLRGFTNNSTNTLINNLQTDGLPGGASRFGSPTTANVERVEVMKGPSSVLFGSMNPGGLINIVTKQPSAKASNSATVSFSDYAGGHNYRGQEKAGYTATIDSTGPIDAGKHWLYRFIASYEDVPTWRQYDWGKNYYFFPSLTYRLDENTEATLKLEIHRQHRFSIQDQSLVAPFNLIANVPNDHSIVYQDSNNTEYDRGDVYNLTLSHRFENKWMVKFSTRDVQHTDGRRLLENNSLVSVLPVENSTVQQRLRDTWNRRRYAYHDLNVYGDVGPDSFKNTLLFGLSAGFETHDFNRWIFKDVTGPNINVYNPVHNQVTYPVYDPAAGPTQVAVSKYYNYAAYASDQIKMGKHWRASLGVHTEKYDTKYTDTAIRNGAFVNPGKVNNTSATVPSFGLVYEPLDSVSLYASYAESFKPTPPQIIDGYGKGFPPEKANQKEVGAKVDVLQNKVSLLLSLYDITRNSVSEPVPQLFDANGIQVYRNLSQKSTGVEVSINFQPVPYVQTQIGYTYDNARISQSAQPTSMGAQIANAPHQSGNLWTRYNIPNGALRGFGVGAGVIYTGKRNGILTNVPANMLTIPSNTRADLAFYYKWKRYDFAINLTNVTDLSYISSADAATDVVPGAPRKIAVSVRYGF